MKQKTQSVDELSAAEGSIFARLRAGVHRRIKAVVALPVATALLTAAIVSVLPDQYTATAVLQIDPRHGLVGVETSNGELVASSIPIESEIAVIQSEAVIKGAAEALHLANDPEIKPDLQTRLRSSLTPGSGNDANNAIATATIYSGLKVSRLRNTLLVNVQFSSPNPELSARVANGVAKAYLTYEANHRSRLAALGKTPTDTIGADAAAAQGETASERMFASLLVKYGAPLAGARMVTNAEVPRTPSSLRRETITALAFALALLASIAIAFALEWRISPQGRRSRAKGVLACPHVTSIPLAAEKTAEIAPSRACRVVLAEPTGSYAGAVRETCRMLDERRNGEAGRILMCVSAVHGEGAELFASNTAHALAIAGRSQLLIDGDLHGKGLTRQLAGQSHRGLFDQVASGLPIENAILRDATTGLHFLPASSQSPISLRAEDILSSRFMRDALTGLRQHFETVILSAPPLTADNAARALADIVDDIIFVTAWNRTPERLAQQALASIGYNRRKVEAAVLTDVAEGRATVMSLTDILGEIQATALAPFRSRAA